MGYAALWWWCGKRDFEGGTGWGYERRKEEKGQDEDGQIERGRMDKGNKKRKNTS